MRARNIKPGFFKNEELCSLPCEARLLFAGLWCLSDREGRLEDRPMRIEAEVFPYKQHEIVTQTPCKNCSNTVQDLLQKLSEKKFILRYEKNEKRYIQILNFEKHQYPHIKEQNSTIPAPYKHGARTGGIRYTES
jgi:hypothetical protein